MISSLTINLSDFALALHLIDNLAGEYYGRLAAAAGVGESATQTIEFEFAAHMNGFALALESYRIQPD